MFRFIRLHKRGLDDSSIFNLNDPEEVEVPSDEAREGESNLNFTCFFSFGTAIPGDFSYDCSNVDKVKGVSSPSCSFSESWRVSNSTK